MKKILIIALFIARLFAQQVGTGGGSTTSVQTIPTQIVTSGLIAQYDFNQGSGTVVTDISSNANNANTINGPTFNSVASGGCLPLTSAGATAVKLPVALNSAVTFQFFIQYQQSNFNSSQRTQAILAATDSTNLRWFLVEPGSTNSVGFNGTGGYGAPFLESLASANPVQVVRGAFRGNAVVTWVKSATVDQFWVNSVQLPVPPTGATGGTGTGALSSGQYFIGGLNAATNVDMTFCYGTVYNRALNANEISQNVQAINQAVIKRGVTVALGSKFGGPLLAIDGDSLPGANGGWLQYASPSTTYGTLQGTYVGTAGYAINDILTQGTTTAVDDLLQNQILQTPSSNGNGLYILNVQIFTNDIAASHNTSVSTAFSGLAAYIRARRAAGWNRIICNDIPDQTGVSAAKDTYNSQYRAVWQTIGCDYFVDMGGNPNLGPDGANTNSYFGSDHVHPNAVGQAEFATMMQKVLNRTISGNLNWASANLYTTAAPAATTITAATSVGATVTLTFAATPATFTVGTDLIIAGVTPSGYNTTTSTNYWCHILTSTATQVTCLNPNLNIGNGTVFGTAQAATMLDSDVYVRLGGSASGNPSFILESCLGFTGQNIYIKNENTTSAWTLTPFNSSETIDGASSLVMPLAVGGNLPVVVLQSTPVSTVNTTGGCFWRQISGILGDSAGNLTSPQFKATGTGGTVLVSGNSNKVGLGNLGTYCWNNNSDGSGSGDTGFSRDSADIIDFGNCTQGDKSATTKATAYSTATANPASTGVLRLANGDTACFRNNANNGDICISKNASDQILLNGNVATASLSATSASLGGSALLAGACSSNTTTVTGATTAMVAIADPNTYPGDGAYWDATVTSANTVTTKVCAVVGLTPTASTYNIKVFTQ